MLLMLDILLAYSAFHYRAQCHGGDIAVRDCRLVPTLQCPRLQSSNRVGDCDF